MSYEGPITIDNAGKADFSSHLWPQFFGLSSQYQMQSPSFREAQWWETQGRGQRLGKLWCRLPFLLSFSPVVLAAGGAVCVPRRTLDQLVDGDTITVLFFPLGNSRCLQWHSQHWEHMISLPLGKISLSNDFLFSPPAGSEERTEERGLFFFSHPFLYAVSSVYWLPTYFISGQNPLVPGCFWTSALVTQTSSVFGFPSLHTQPGDNEINFVQIKSKQCSENYWRIDYDNIAPR